MVVISAVVLESITGVINFEGMLGACIFNSPGLTKAALSLGDGLCFYAEMIGPDTFEKRSKSD